MALSPDMVLYNGKICTMKSKANIVEAIAIKGDRVIATGSNQDIKGLSHNAGSICLLLRPEFSEV